MLITAFCFLFTRNLLSTITYSPLKPNVGQEVSFTVTHPDGIAQDRVLWNFGDGTPAGYDSSSVVKIYLRKGVFNVSASYTTLRGQSQTDRVTVTVVERRRITNSPLYPAVNTPVTFRAENFFSALVRWNFGDGTEITGSTVETHTYTATGLFTVTASETAGAAQGATFTTTVRVAAEARGPRAAFQIYFIQLRFDDGKSYKIVRKDFSPLAAFADIKFEGTGVLRAQWVLDGNPMGIITKTLRYAGQATIDSSEIISLPTITPGIHEVSLRIIEPQTEYQVPAIRYFVAQARPEIDRVDLSLTKVTTLDKTEIAMDRDYIEAPRGEYFLLKGAIRSEIEKEIPFVLFRIYLDDKLVDQKLLENVKPKQKIEFETSIYNNSPELKKIYLAFYDISVKPPVLLYFKRYILLPRGQ